MKIKFYLFAILSVLTSVLGLYRAGVKAGERAHTVKQQEVIKQSNKVARNVEEHINSESDVNVLTGLRNKWTRRK